MAPLHHHFELKGWDEADGGDPVLDHLRPLRRRRAWVIFYAEWVVGQ
jgi:UDP-N-acetylmuramyl pentapeptide phosphotransferase/UDP-N-acetylglucosamine-1-phosphate transferase